MAAGMGLDLEEKNPLMSSQALFSCADHDPHISLLPNQTLQHARSFVRMQFIGSPLGIGRKISSPGEDCSL
jgi:hypothetical protein